MDPNAPSRVRHEMSTPASSEDAVAKLEELTEFLGRVKDSARLRAKEEQGVSFLHTRTGTIFGRILKWLTAGSREAIEQRNRARQLVMNVLQQLKPASEEAKKQMTALKKTILEKTLAIDSREEFDIHVLRNQLGSIRKLIARPPDDGMKSVDIDDSSISSETEDAQQSGSDYEGAASEVNSWPESESYAASAESDPPNIRLASEASGPAESVASQNISIDNTQHPARGDGKTQAAAPDPIKRSSFGCLPVEAPLSVKALHKIEDYQAEAYLMPVRKDGLRFALGGILRKSDNSEKDNGSFDCPEGIRFFDGIHKYKNETRPIRKLELEAIAEAGENSFASMSRDKKDAYLETLRQRYTHALEYAFRKGARTFAVEPLRVALRLIPDEEIKALANAVRSFQQTHPDTQIHVVLQRPQEVMIFNE